MLIWGKSWVTGWISSTAKILWVSWGTCPSESSRIWKCHVSCSGLEGRQAMGHGSCFGTTVHSGRGILTWKHQILRVTPSWPGPGLALHFFFFFTTSLMLMCLKAPRPLVNFSQGQAWGKRVPQSTTFSMLAPHPIIKYHLTPHFSPCSVTWPISYPQGTEFSQLDRFLPTQPPLMFLVTFSQEALAQTRARCPNTPSAHIQHGAPRPPSPTWGKQCTIPNVSQTPWSM